MAFALYTEIVLYPRYSLWPARVIFPSFARW